MKKNRRAFALILMGIAAAALGVIAVRMVSGRAPAVHEAKGLYYCPMHPTYTSDRPGDCPICNMKLVKKETGPAGSHAGHKTAAPAAGSEAKNICVMHNCPMAHDGRPCPMLVVAKAGEEVSCPVCGSHVAGSEPVENASGSPAGYAALRISPRKQQIIGVKTALVQRRTLVKTLRTVGRIAYDPELYQAQAEYLQAIRALKKAREGTDPVVAEQAGHLADSSRTRLRLLGFGDGLIQELEGSEGPDDSLLVADPKGRVWLYAPVYEFELPKVRVGQTVRAESQAIPAKAWEGEIRSIDPVLDPMTRSARVRAVLSDPEKMLKPEMFVNASIELPLGEALAVPEEAIFDTGARRIVFVDKGEGLFDPREVVLGAKAEGFFEVKSGVAEGESVVTSGNFLIDSESRLTAALEGMGGGAGHQHGQ